MDLVQILLFYVVGLSVVLFCMIKHLDSVQNNRDNSYNLEQKSSLLCDSESKIRTGSEEGGDQEEEKGCGGGADNGGGELVVSGIFERVGSIVIGELSEAEKSNLFSSLSGINGDNKGEILSCDMDINAENDEVAGGDFEDWEGVERTELEKAFGKAVAFVSSKVDADRVNGDVELQLYGLQRVALEGVCCGSQPMALKFSARAKWNAWQKLGNMGRETAMEKYINIVSEHIPEWKGEGMETTRSN